MALIFPYEDAFGSTNATAYWRVVEVNCNWLTSNAHMIVLVYKSKAARNNGKQPLASKSYDFDSTEVDGVSFNTVYGEANLNTNNPIKASYIYLKTLPEYASATDDL